MLKVFFYTSNTAILYSQNVDGVHSFILLTISTNIIFRNRSIKVP